jgi:hypothetical protein
MALDKIRELEMKIERDRNYLYMLNNQIQGAKLVEITEEQFPLERGIQRITDYYYNNGIINWPIVISKLVVL